MPATGSSTRRFSTIRRAQRADNPDWQLLAAEGGILDSLGRNGEARERYRQALVLAPGEPQVLNNLGMSYVLTNELDAAEQTLRQAVANPRATLRIRENLALVQGLRSGGGRAAAPAPQAADAAPRSDTWRELAASG